MKRAHSLTAIALTGLVSFSSLCAPIAAVADEQGKKNTAIGLGAAALGLLLTQKNKLAGLAAAGGAAYAYSQYDKDVKKRHQREQYGYYDGRSNNDYHTNRDNTNGRYNRDNGYRTTGDNRYDPYNQDRDYRNNRDNSAPYNQDNGYRNNRDDNNDQYNQDNGYRDNENRQDDGYRYHENGRAVHRRDDRSRAQIDSVGNRGAARRTGSVFTRN